ncbi:disease resistance protein RPV1-like [Hibiscus syriacus]|uniref:disease resistance protein RPV1-like n=1 Tax=Hibiscus syriacus TaxID=106335 RepID=UPI001920E00B|nr:disease resistance protein RPV1-like [Hibiscus syriacus]
MASSSRHLKHDVFLSFSGEDTRNNFTSYLCQSLRRKGVGAYMDENQLKTGHNLSPALLKAIQESKISLIIFSKSYASSSWCLEELFKIMELKRLDQQVVVPIFYHVNPSDVRKRTGGFEEAFANHQKSWAHQLKGWEDSFSEAGYIKGWHIAGDKSDRSEAEYVMKIVEDIVKKLDSMSVNDTKGFVGVDHHKEQIKDLLRVNEKDIPMIGIGIWGMGGIGKTTLAQAVFDEVCGEFDSCCFLANVREKSERRDGITSLRDKLLSEMLEEETLGSGTPRTGSKFRNDRLRRKRVLVVLDDVNDLDQLEILVGGNGIDHFGFGSRVIITSRDQQVLKNGSVDKIYKVEGLNYLNSLHLFSLYAFKKTHPLYDFADLSNRVIEYAKGVPIALKVLGSTLYKKTEEQWESALDKLKDHPNPKIYNLLKISFDGLDDIERDIFLDIACFFKGEKTEVVAKILNSCYKGAHFGISNLVDKCLIDIVQDLDNTLWMHDLLQEMGWNIVRQESKDPGERSRLWIPKDVSRVLKHDAGTKSVEGIFLDMHEIDGIQLHQDVFQKMHNLRFIKFYYSQFSGKEGCSLLSQQDLNSLPGELSYLHWEHCPLKSLPPNFTPGKLVELRLPDSDLEQLWDKDQNLANLRVIDLRNCKNLTKIPDLSRALNIEELDFCGCINLTELPCMVHMKFLENLSLKDCPVTKFPEIPRTIKTLNLSGTQIEEVPSSIKCFNRLSSLHVCRTRIHNLPESVVKMDSLEIICLSHCPNIIHFPSVSENTKKLILAFTQIEEVPASIGCLSKLALLDMSGTKIGNLPSTIGSMASLKAIHICHCLNITQFPNVPKTIEILLMDNTPIEEIPSSIALLRGLSKLSMSDCTRIKSLPTSICQLKSLRELCLQGCSNLENFPEILETMQCLIQLAFFKRVIINDSPILNELIIRVHYRRNLSVLSVILSNSFLKFHTLSTLDLSVLSVILSNSFLKFHTLLTLDLSGSNIVKIPMSIRQLPNLISLYLKCCKNLILLPELPPCLQNLNAHDCTSLELVLSGRHFSENSRLVHMLFSNCFNLDQDVINNIVANAQIRLQCMVEEWVKEWSSSGLYEIIPDKILDRVVACSEISERFKYQCMDSSITIKLCPDWKTDRFLCFVPSVVVDFDNNQKDIVVQIVCEIQLKTKCHDCHSFVSRWTPPLYYDEPIFFESNNMIIWFDKNMFQKDQHYKEASFEFYIAAKDDGKRVDHIKVEKCGVHVFYVDAKCSIDCNVRSNKKSSSGEEEGKQALRLLESSYGVSAYLPCTEDDETGCTPNIMQFRPNSPTDLNWLSTKRSFNNLEFGGSSHQEDINFNNDHDNLTLRRSFRSYQRFNFDDDDEPESKKD